MKAPVFLGLVLVLAMVVASGGTVGADPPPGPGGVAAQAALGTAFTYQGSLRQSGTPVNSTCDFQFSLWDNEAAGAQVGSTLAAANVSVSNGLFTTPLDFGPARFDGQARWLGITVRCPAGAGEFTNLTPRQSLTAAPYALYATASGTAASATSATAAATAPWSGLTGVPAGFADGVDDVGWTTAGNAGTSGSSFLGTTDAMTLTLKVSDTVGLRLEPTATTPNVIGGFRGNVVSAGVTGATIGGGGSASGNSFVGANFGTVGGGSDNRVGFSAGDVNATVGGGLGNFAAGENSTVGGGKANFATSRLATVGGGAGNTAAGENSTVGGGNANLAFSRLATVGGGAGNTAGGENSTVPGGSSALASHYGEMAYASGGFSASGDAQTSIYVLRNTTSDATPTSLFLNGSLTPSKRLTIAAGRTVAFEALVVARSSAGDSAGVRIRGAIKNVGGTTTLLALASGEFIGQDPALAGTSAVAAPDDVNDALDIVVTGAASTTIGWVATVRTTEVAF